MIFLNFRILSLSLSLEPCLVISSVIDIPIVIFFHELSKVDILSSPDTALVSFYVMHMYMHPYSWKYWIQFWQIGNFLIKS